ncbi:hypothetical protein D9M71_118450 [compost metagenome]
MVENFDEAEVNHEIALRPTAKDKLSCISVQNWIQPITLWEQARSHRVHLLAEQVGKSTEYALTRRFPMFMTKGTRYVFD